MRKSEVDSLAEELFNREWDDSSAADINKCLGLEMTDGQLERVYARYKYLKRIQSESTNSENN